MRGKALYLIPGLFSGLVSALLLEALAGEAGDSPGRKAPPKYPDHSKLLVVIGAGGEERPVKDSSDWAHRREHITQGMEEVMGPFRHRGPLQPASVSGGGPRFTVEGEEESGAYVLKRIAFLSQPGERVPALLLIPRGLRGKVPGVLCLHQTTRLGKGEPAGMGGKDHWLTSRDDFAIRVFFSSLTGKSMKTFRIRNEDVRRRWYHIDAAGQTLGKVAVRAASILMGKENPTFTPGVDSGDFVVVTNAEKVRISGRKTERKIYRHHTQYLGGLVEEPLQHLLGRRPKRVVELAVRRMLPKNTLGRHFLRRLKIYAGEGHPHAAQTPERIEVLRARAVIGRRPKSLTQEG